MISIHADRSSSIGVSRTSQTASLDLPLRSLLSVIGWLSALCARRRQVAFETRRARIRRTYRRNRALLRPGCFSFDRRDDDFLAHTEE